MTKEKKCYQEQTVSASQFLFFLFPSSDFYLMFSGEKPQRVHDALWITGKRK
jgi:hypothetical protein